MLRGAAIHGPVLQLLLEALLNLVLVATTYKKEVLHCNYPVFEKITPLQFLRNPLLVLALQVLSETFSITFTNL